LLVWALEQLLRLVEQEDLLEAVVIWDQLLQDADLVALAVLLAALAKVQEVDLME
jgi:hypothetical protein